MIVYRITKSKRASDLSGTGAALYPGRWNKKGVPVLYTGENPEIALLANLLHIPALMAPNLDIVSIEVPDDSMTSILVSQLPEYWFHFPAPDMLAEIGHQWIDKGDTLALCVPSAIIHTSHNFIFNCHHPLYDDIKIIDQKPFYLDTRLLK